MVDFLKGLGQAVSGRMDDLSADFDENPEKYAIMLDMLGKNLDPNNPFAGIGQAMGTSSLADKAMKEEKKDRLQWAKMISDIVSGKTPTTTPGQPGVSGVTIKPSKEGDANEINFSVTEPTEKGKLKAAQEQKFSLGDLMHVPF